MRFLDPSKVIFVFFLRKFGQLPNLDIIDLLEIRNIEI